MKNPFEIPLSNQRPIFGAFLAAHAIPDAINLMFTGVGCKAKAQRQIAAHDSARDAGSKMVWADVGDVELITGPIKRLRNMAVETCRRRNGAGIIIISTSSAMEMTGADVESVLSAIRREVDCPVVHVPTPGWEGDQFTGYAGVVESVMELPRWEKAAGDQAVVNVVGYVLDRYERDHSANLDELGHLLRLAGVEPGAIFFAGGAMDSLMKAPAAGRHVVLPYARALSRQIRKETGRRAAVVDLPVGPRASSRFVADTARLAGAEKRALRRAARDELMATEAALTRAAGGLAGHRVAVLADTPLAAGLCSFFAGIKMVPVLAGLLDRTLGGETAFRAALGRDGHSLPGCRVLADPSAGELETACRELLSKAADNRLSRGHPARTPFDLMVAPGFWLPSIATEGIPRVELGFPSNGWHPGGPAPCFGFSGARFLAARILRAVQACS